MATTATPTHRVSVAVAHARADLASVADAAAWSMSDQEAADALVELTRHESEVAELKARVARYADEQQVGQDRGASSTAVWLANQTQVTRAAAHSAVKLGKDLHVHPLTRKALAAGAICQDQARTILRWLQTLPDDLDPALLLKAEEHLLQLAQDHDARALDKLGRRLWEVIDPEGADAREAEILAREEARAAQSMYLKTREDGRGSLCGEFKIPSLGGAALKKMVAAVTAAKHQNATKGAGTGHLAASRATPEAQGEAFYELIMRYPAGKLPKLGGLNATLVVMISEDSLMGRLEQAGVLDTGERISPGAARQLACEAGILPMVLGGRSEVLDAGREQRLYSKTQRLAINVQQHFQCATEGCDRATGTHGLHAHHELTWADNGPTDLKNGIGLCHWHHMKAHDVRYEMTRTPAGSVSFHRRL